MRSSWGNLLSDSAGPPCPRLNNAACFTALPLSWDFLGHRRMYRRWNFLCTGSSGERTSNCWSQITGTYHRPSPTFKGLERPAFCISRNEDQNQDAVNFSIPHLWRGNVFYYCLCQLIRSNRDLLSNIFHSVYSDWVLKGISRFPITLWLFHLIFF